MKDKPILIIAGEPKSIFFEIFFTAISLKPYKSPLILICCKKILLDQMRKNKFKKKINILNIQKLKKYDLNNKSINLINIECKKYNSNFNTKFTNQYIKSSFKLAIKLINDGFSYKLINGPIKKSPF